MCPHVRLLPPAECCSAWLAFKSLELLAHRSQLVCRAGSRRALLCGLNDLKKDASNARDNGAAEVGQVVSTAGSAPKDIAESSPTFTKKAVSGAKDAAAIANDIKKGDNAAAVNKAGKAADAAGAANDCTGNTVMHTSYLVYKCALANMHTSTGARHVWLTHRQSALAGRVQGLQRRVWRRFRSKLGRHQPTSTL